MRRLLTSILNGAVAGILLVATSPSPSTAQFVQPYLSQDEVGTATEVAQDSIGSGAMLIAIATQGEIDLSPAGFPLTAAGFDESSGTSSVWAYQFATPGNEKEGAVVVVNLSIVPQITQVQEGNLYGVTAHALDLTGAYSGSDQFAARLSADPTFAQFRIDYPDMVANAIVLTWEPDEELLTIPESFPADKPIWGIFFNTDAWGDGDSSLVCFVSSGSGESHCVRSSISGVETSSESNTSSSIELSGRQPASSDSPELQVQVSLGEGESVVEFGLFDLQGRTVTDLTRRATSHSGASREISLSLPVDGLSAGEYFLRLVTTSGITSRKVIVE